MLPYKGMQDLNDLSKERAFRAESGFFVDLGILFEQDWENLQCCLHLLLPEQMIFKAVKMPASAKVKKRQSESLNILTEEWWDEVTLEMK